MDLGLALIAAGIKLDCPNIRDLKEKKKRPPHMRKIDWIPCDCGRCFFCKNGFTRGVQHKPRHQPKKPPPARLPLPPSQHPTDRQDLKSRGWCVLCLNHLTPAQKKLPAEEQRKCQGCIGLGCPECNGGKELLVCKHCWKTHNHTL